jgi:DNA polymerase III delta prime subunit
MNQLLPKNWDSLHHAYLIVKDDVSSLWQELEDNLGFIRKANPDALSLELETFGIDEARDLSLWAIKKSFGERKVAVIKAPSITVEAQNALLKLFEEPTIGTHFFILISGSGNILGTLLSRVRLIDNIESVDNEKPKTPFLKSPISKRLKIIAPIIKDKDKLKAKGLLNQISKEINQNKKDIASLEMIINAERFLSGRAPSVKMIMEHLAISLPVI